MKNLELKQRLTTFRSKLHWPSRSQSIGVGVLLLLIIIGLAVYLIFFREPKAVREARKDFDTTMKAVGRLYALPAEVPQLATVTDLEKLKSQPFFDVAQNGDKVLVFTIGRKVILYRPSTKKIINFSNLNPNELQVQAQLPDQTTNGSTPIPTAEPMVEEPTTPPTMTINNGTTIAGLTQKVQQKLQAAKLNVTIAARGNAATQAYDTTLVVALTPTGEKLADTIAQTLGGTVAALPEGETTSGTDILIIAGKDAAVF